jgi:hypothetical protein
VTLSQLFLDCPPEIIAFTDRLIAIFPQEIAFFQTAGSQTSTFALSELSWMNSRRGSTISPINLVKMSSASSASLTLTCNSERSLVSSVVSLS